jgi:predicted adenylyl cyclase CyaB
MPREIESKFRLDDPDAINARLANLTDLQRIREEFEENTILDTAERMLLARGCGLRIRRATDCNDPSQVRCKLTFKGPRESGPTLAAAGVKAREEIETTAGDAEVLQMLFARLGYQPVIYYEKRRTTWQASDVEIVVDELPHLGWFAEIEAPNPQVLDQWRQRLGFPLESAVPDTYVKLTAEHGVVGSDGVRRLAFPTLS